MGWKMTTATYPCPTYTDKDNKRRFLFFLSNKFQVFCLENLNQFTWAVEGGELVVDAY